MSDISKIYTDHALMDEIVYNSKKILEGIILKNDATADANETSDSLTESEYFVSINAGNIDLYTFPITTEALINYGFTALEADIYSEDRDQLIAALTETEQEDLLAYLSKDYISNYVEKNNYYRMLNGKPNYDPQNDTSLNYYTIAAKIWDDSKGAFVISTLAFTDYLSGFYGKAYVKVFDTSISRYVYKTLYLLSYSIFLYNVPVIYGDGTSETIKISYEQFDDQTFMDYYETKLNANFTSEELNTTTSLEHLQDYQINTMDSVGIIGDLKDKFITNNTTNSSKFRYLRFLGSKKIDIYTARSAANWDILYMPTVEYLVEDRFKELFAINRDIYERRTYQDAYKIQSEYYDEIMMIMIIAQTFNDIIVDIPEWYIRRDIFDLRSVKYFLDSQGVEYFPEIPLKYQIRIVKNLNKLIKYKSTEKNINDILDIFSIDNAEIYKYFILKKYLYTDHTTTDPDTPDPGWTMDAEYDFGFQNEYTDMDDTTVYNTGDGNGGDSPGYDVYEFGDDSANIDYGDTVYDYNFGNEEEADAPDSSDTDRNDEYDEANTIIKDEYDNVYGLQFVKVPIDEQYDDYIKDPINRKDYDTITEEDNYWDGIDLHSLVKNNHLKKDFTIEGTKYLGIEYNVSMEDYKFQTAYFIGMIFNSNINMSDISIPISSIKADTYFTLQSLFVFLYCCNRLYENKSLDIFDPTTLEQTGAKPEYDAYIDCDGGRPWNDSGDPEPVTPVTPVEWTVPDIDGGDEDDPNFVITEVVDFGNGDYVIDPTETLYDYDYKEITPTSIDTDEETTSPEVTIIDNGIITVTLTEANYKTYLYHYVINADESLTQLTEDNYTNYLNTQVKLRYPWYYEDKGYLGLDADGHNLYQDSKHEPVYYSKADSKYKRVSDNSDPVGTLSLIRVDYVQEYDGGGVEQLNSESYYDWLRSNHKEFYTDLTDRVLGFNMYTATNGKTIKDTVEENISIRHSAFGWDRGYTLDEVGCANYTVQTKFTTITDLINVYKKNKVCYDNIRKLMATANSRDEYMVYKYVYEQLFTRKYDKNFYTLSNGSTATNFLQVLKDKDITLYNYYITLSDETDEDTRIAEIRQCLNDIVSTLSYYLTDPDVKLVLSFIYTNSFDSVLYYMSLLLNFFKSWKTYFVSAEVVYDLNDKVDHSDIGRDTLNEIKIKYWTTGNSRIRDAWQTIIKRYIEDTPVTQTTRNKEIIDIAAHYVDNDITGDKDYDGGNVESIVSGTDTAIDLDGGGVSKLSCSPFYQLDGRGIADRLDVYDLDGGGPKENEFYLDIDGKSVSDTTAYTRLNPRSDYDSGVDVDCGHPDFRQVMTNTTITKADEKNNITVDARISTYDNNGISINNDGLYIYDNYTETAKITDLVGNMLNYKRYVNEIKTACISDLAVASNPDLAKSRIDNLYKKKFANANKVLNIFKYSDYENRLIIARDSKITDFRVWFRNNNPFDYEEVK